MAKAEQVLPNDPRSGAGVRAKGRKVMHDIPIRDLRAPVQVLRSTKEWLDQIIEEKKFKTYDEAIMLLITERQRHLPPDFGIFPDLKEYVCTGED